MADPLLVTPSPADPADAARWAYTALVRRMHTGLWRPDAFDRMGAMIGHVKRDAWGEPDLSANPELVCATQLSRSCDAPPAVTPPDGGLGADVVRLVARAGHWVRAPIIQRDAWGMGEVFVRVDLDGRGRPTQRVVYGDRITVEADPDHPDRPMVLRELMRQRIGDATEKVWVWHVYDLSDPDHPSWKVCRDDGGKAGADVTEHVLGSRFEGEGYPYRYADGEPFIPYVIYRSVESGSVWNTYIRREIVEGTLNLAVYYTFFGHILRSASWPQRYVVNAVLAGAGTQDETSGRPGPDGRRGGRGGRSQLVTDPATVVVLKSLADDAGQPMVSQWQPGGDPMVVIEAVGVYERRLGSYAGISGADQMRMSGDPRSGYAISVSRTALREQMRRTEPLLRRADEDLFRMTAALLRAATGKDYPEEGYDIVYQGVPESPDERAARRAHVLELLREGLIDRVDAYMEMNPGVTAEEAEVALDRIGVLNRMRDPEAAPAEPETPAQEVEAVEPTDGTEPAGLNGAQIREVALLVEQLAFGFINAETARILFEAAGMDAAAAARLASVVQKRTPPEPAAAPEN